MVPGSSRFPSRCWIQRVHEPGSGPCIRTTVFHHGPYKTTADVEYATAGWIDWYNNRRLHSTLGNVPPVEYEQAHYAALNREPHPV
jgi:putative transposase